MADHFVTLGAFGFKSQNIEVGGLPRTVTVAANALSSEPVQVNAFTSDYMQVLIEGILQGEDTDGETATAHLVRLKTNLATEVQKDTNTLTIAWAGLTAETFRVFKNQNFPMAYTWHVQESKFVPFSLTLNCLP